MSIIITTTRRTSITTSYFDGDGNDINDNNDNQPYHDLFHNPTNHTMTITTTTSNTAKPTQTSKACNCHSKAARWRFCVAAPLDLLA